MSSTSSVATSEKHPTVKEGVTVSEKNDMDYEGQFDEEQLTIINEHIDDRSVDECLVILKDALVEHYNDPSLSRNYYLALEDLVSGRAYDETEEDWEYRIKFETFLIHDWSIYPAVRSVTRPYAELDEGPCETIRGYLIMIFYSCAGSTLATFFSPRYPSISISSLALMMLMAWTGKLFSYIPGFSFPIGYGRRVHFGSGKWTYKEQLLTTSAMSMGDQSSYAQYAIIAMANEYFYNFKDAQGNFGFSVMLTLTSNLMGVGLAGIFRTFLIYPVQLINWAQLPQLRLCRTLIEPEPKENINGWTISGIAVFWISFVVFFCWYWITSFVIQFFSYFDWMAWISPSNADLVNITGVYQAAMGYNPLGSLDPTLTGLGSMITPYYATFLSWFGMMLSGFIVIGMFYQNTSYTSYIPINDQSLHDGFGEKYNISRILNADNLLDKDEFLDYTLPYWSAGSLVSYGSFFATYPAIIVYSMLEYGLLIWNGLKKFYSILLRRSKGLEMFNDRFSRAQRKYKEVPEWWYIFLLIASIGVGIATVEHYSFTQTPVWTIFFGIGLSAIFMIPTGILLFVTNVGIEINVLFELIIGLILPGNGNALMISKVYATNFMSETNGFIENLKLGHYANIPPRSMFRMQVVSLICNSFVQAGLTTWQSVPDAIPNMCSPENYYTNKFICLDTRVFFNAAVQWGTLGPKRVLRDLYPNMRYTFLFGALYPIPFWFVRHFVLAYARRHGWGELKQGAGKVRNSSIIRSIASLEWVVNFNELLLLSGALNWGGANIGWVTPTLYTGLIFAWYLPKYFPKWWAKYNYLIYAGYGVGVSISGIIIFFALQYKNVPDWSWWGNDVGISLQPAPRLPIPEEGFGPKPRW